MKKLVVTFVAVILSLMFSITSLAKEVAITIISVGPEENEVVSSEVHILTENEVVIDTVEIINTGMVITQDDNEKLMEDATKLVGPAETVVKDFKRERLDYYLSVLNTMDEDDLLALRSVCYNESICAWRGANYETDHNYQAMLDCTAGVIETILNRLGSEQFGFKTKISKICVSGQFVRYPNKRSDSVEFNQALAMLIDKYENGETMMPWLDGMWFSTDRKVGHRRSSATSGNVQPEDTVWIGEYRADGSPRKGFGHWYRRVF